MARKTESPNSSARAHRPRPKSKPKFELPVENTEQEAAAAWVHRTAAEETPSDPVTAPVAAKHHISSNHVSSKIAAKPEAEIPKLHTELRPEDSVTFISLGVALMAAGFAVMTQASMAAFGIMTAPVRWGRRLLPGR